MSRTRRATAVALMLLGVAACSPGAGDDAPSPSSASSGAEDGEVLRVPASAGDGRRFEVGGVGVTVPADMEVRDRAGSDGVLEVLLDDGERFALRLELFPEEDDGQDPVTAGVLGGRTQLLGHPDVSDITEPSVEWEGVDRVGAVQGLMEMPDGSRRAVGLLVAVVPQGVLNAYVESETEDLADAPGLAVLGTARTR